MDDLKKLKEYNKTSSGGKLIYKIIIILIIGGLLSWAGYSAVKSNDDQKKDKEELATNLSLGIYQNRDDMINKLSIQTEGYWSVIIGSDFDPVSEEDNPYYKTKNYSGLNQLRADYFQVKDSDYFIRATSNIHTLQISDIRKVDGSDLKTWMKFDEMQSKHSEKLNKKESDPEGYKELIEFIDKNPFLKN